jgi:threonine/homoserine/homoserine lactone efflux protein
MGETLPLALAIAASPFPIIPVILLRFTSRARPAALAFLGVFAVGIATATTVFVLLAEVVELLDKPPTWASITRIVIGLALIAWAIRQWLTRHQTTELPSWMTTIETAGPRQAARYGLLLSLANPKVVLLAAAAGLGLGSSGDSAAAVAGSVVIFTAVSCLGVAIPVALFLVRGERMLGPLGRARDWLQRNNAAVMAVVFVIIGIALVAKGASAL